MSVKPVTPNIKRCSCCPYGIHVDNDFIKYCESLLLHVRRTRQVPGPRETKSLPRKAPSLARSDSLSLNCDCSFKTGTSSSSSLASEPYISSTTFSSRSISLPHDDSSLKDAVDRFEEVLLDHNRRSQRSKQRVPDTLQVASAQGNLSSLQLESPPESPASELSTSATTPVSRDYHNGYRTRGVEPNPAPRSFTRPIRSNSIVTGPAAEQIPEDEPIALGKDQEQDESYIPRTLPRLSRRSSILSLKSDKLESPKEDDVFIVQETGYAKKELVDASTITDDYALEKVAINTISIPPSSPSKSDVATFTELVRVVCQATETLPVPVNSASCQTLKSDMKDSDANTESDQFVQAILATCERMTQTIQVESCDAEVHVSSRCTICEMKQSETVSVQVNLSSLDIQHEIKSDHNHNEQVIDVEKQTERLKEERQVEKSPESPKTTKNSNNLIIEDSGDEILVYRDPETIDDEISDVPPNAKHRTLLPQMVDGEFGLNADSGAVSETSESGDEASGQSASKISRSAICENIATNTKEITLEFRAALKVLNDSLQKMDRAKKSATAKSVEIIEKEWFRITGSNNADCGVVEYYLDVFESYSKHLLNYIVNLIDANGNTAMHYAISRSDFDTVSVLLDSKVCDVNKQNNAGYSAVMLVSLAQVSDDTQKAVIRRLFQLSDVNIRAKPNGQTALMLAASHGHLTTCQLLIESGAAINVQDNDGSTALMCAAEHGRSEVVRLLLSHPECDTNVLDNDGSTALSIAMESGNKDIGLTLYASTSMLSRGSSVYASLRRSQSNGNSSDFKRTGSLRGRIAVAERTIPQAPKNGSKPRSPYQPLASD